MASFSPRVAPCSETSALTEVKLQQPQCLVAGPSATPPSSPSKMGVNWPSPTPHRSSEPPEKPRPWVLGSSRAPKWALWLAPNWVLWVCWQVGSEVPQLLEEACYLEAHSSTTPSNPGTPSMAHAGGMQNQPFGDFNTLNGMNHQAPVDRGGGFPRVMRPTITRPSMGPPRPAIRFNIGSPVPGARNGSIDPMTQGGLEPSYNSLRAQARPSTADSSRSRSGTNIPVPRSGTPSQARPTPSVAGARAKSRAAPLTRGRPSTVVPTVVGARSKSRAAPVNRASSSYD